MNKAKSTSRKIPTTLTQQPHAASARMLLLPMALVANFFGSSYHTSLPLGSAICPVFQAAPRSASSLDKICMSSLRVAGLGSLFLPLHHLRHRTQRLGQTAFAAAHQQQHP